MQKVAHAQIALIAGGGIDIGTINVNSGGQLQVNDNRTGAFAR